MSETSLSRQSIALVLTTKLTTKRIYNKMLSYRRETALQGAL